MDKPSAWHSCPAVLPKLHLFLPPNKSVPLPSAAGAGEGRALPSHPPGPPQLRLPLQLLQDAAERAFSCFSNRALPLPHAPGAQERPEFALLCSSQAAVSASAICKQWGSALALLLSRHKFVLFNHPLPVGSLLSFRGSKLHLTLFAGSPAWSASKCCLSSSCRHEPLDIYPCYLCSNPSKWGIATSPVL